MRLLFGVIWLLSPCAAFAFGPLGHQIIGAIADARLGGTPAGSKVRGLLDGFTLEKASVIPDEIKGWDKNGADDPNIFHYSSRPRIDAQLRAFWNANPPTQDLSSPMPSHHWFHYTDVPILHKQKYGDGKTGRSRWDIVQAMRYCIAVLQGSEPEENARRITRPIAIILLAHFVGDIHQPLHVGAQYFNDKGDAVDPDSGTPGLEAEGGNTIIFKHSAAAARRLGHRQSKLHGFWDHHAVKANLPQLPEAMAKEERRAHTEQARQRLIEEFLREGPPAWRMAPAAALLDYPERWADEILPLAREAHERLTFHGMHTKEEDGHLRAAGFAEEKPAADGIEYDEWAARIVRMQMHRAGWRLADLLEKALP